MKSKLPSLKGLQAFEVVSRHLSFARAADELNVSPAAVSQQIKLLEENLNIQLFSRTTRALSLSNRGREALPFISDAFEKLNKANTLLRQEKSKNIITVSVVPSFGSRWLLPRLEKFLIQNPDITVHIDSRNELADFTTDGVDIAIRQGLGDYPDLECELLISDCAFVVCSRHLLENGEPYRSPKDLIGKNLLHVNWRIEMQDGPSWETWARYHSVEGVDTTIGNRFSMDDMSVRAAIGGLGFALETHAFVADDLAAGRLVRALPEKYDMPTLYHHYVVHPPFQRTKNRKIELFKNWLFEEANS